MLLDRRWLLPTWLRLVPRCRTICLALLQWLLRVKGFYLFFNCEIIHVLGSLRRTCRVHRVIIFYLNLWALAKFFNSFDKVVEIFVIRHFFRVLLCRKQEMVQLTISHGVCSLRKLTWSNSMCLSCLCVSIYRRTVVYALLSMLAHLAATVDQTCNFIMGFTLAFRGNTESLLLASRLSPWVVFSRSATPVLLLLHLVVNLQSKAALITRLQVMEVCTFAKRCATSSLISFVNTFSLIIRRVQSLQLHLARSKLRAFVLHDNVILIIGINLLQIFENLLFADWWTILNVLLESWWHTMSKVPACLQLSNRDVCRHKV